ncbi:hypothetical protein YC2023_032055 [Brassica napus]
MNPFSFMLFFVSISTVFTSFLLIQKRFPFLQSRLSSHLPCERLESTVSDVWCGKGVGFSTDAVSLDPPRRNLPPSRRKIDVDKNSSNQTEAETVWSGWRYSHCSIPMLLLGTNKRHVDLVLATYFANVICVFSQETSSAQSTCEIIGLVSLLQVKITRASRPDLGKKKLRSNTRPIIASELLYWSFLKKRAGLNIMVLFDPETNNKLRSEAPMFKLINQSLLFCWRFHEKRLAPQNITLDAIHRCDTTLHI